MEPLGARGGLKCLFPELELRARWEGQPSPQSGAGVTLLPGLLLQKGPEAKMCKEAIGGKMLFQLKREFSSVASYKINIQNLVAYQTPQNNCNKIY